MPCRPDEEFAQGPEESYAEQPRTPPRKRVTVTESSDAKESDSDAEKSNSERDSNAEIQSKKGDWKMKEFVHYQSHGQ